MNRLLVLLIGLISIADAFAIESPDTILSSSRFSPYSHSSKNAWWGITIAGAGYTIPGVIASRSMHDWGAVRFSEEQKGVVDIAQYTPLAFPWVMKMCGSPTRSGWGRMAISHGASVAIMATTVSLLKDNYESMRPDGSDMRSFPSGHTAWAYLGATVTARELAWRSPWYAVGAYSVASAIGMQRVIDRRHMPCDVFAGAGIGILSAQAGYYIGDIISGNRQIEHRISEITEPNDFTPSFTLSNTFSIPLSDMQLGDVTLSLSPAIETSVEAVYPFNDNWGVGIAMSMRSAPIFVESCGKRTFVAPLNSVGVTLVPSYRVAINDVFAFNAEVGARYSAHLHVKSVERSVSSSSGSMSGMANVGFDMRLTDDMSVGATIGYEISHYEFGVKPSSIYGITSTQSKSFNIGAINVGISMSAAF